MQALMREKLNKGFSNVEMQQQPDATVAKQTAAHFVFTGEQEAGLMRGECHLMTYKGIGYIFFAWALAEKFADHQKDFQMMRDRFGLLSGRDNWSPQRTNLVVFTLHDANYQIEDSEGIWKARLPAGEDQDPKTADPYGADPKDIDAQATVALIARLPIKNARARGIDFVPEAHGLVLVLDKAGGDPIQMVRQHILARTKKEDPDAEVVLEDVKEPATETPLPQGGPTIARLQMRFPKNRDGTWYFVVSALPIGGKLVVVETKCRNAGRNTSYAADMEPFMIKLAASLKEKS
jgi:hypothetical protein